MHNQLTTTWELLADELQTETLKQLTGGTRGIDPLPNDLVTPAQASSPYDGDAPDEVFGDEPA